MAGHGSADAEAVAEAGAEAGADADADADTGAEGIESPAISCLELAVPVTRTVY